MLFTHELLDSYTSSYTTSQTPFAAFCTTIRHHYQNYTAYMRFCSDETFVRAWFAFSQLQDLGNTMQCPTCGPSPSIVIADGVSLATHASKLTSAVRPPTFTDTSSESITTITPYKARKLPPIPQKELRSLLLRFLESPPASSAEAPNTGILAPLCAKYPALAPLTELYVQLPVNDVRRKAYKELLSQVRRPGNATTLNCSELITLWSVQIAAPDIVLQLVPYDAIQPMSVFVETGVMPNWLQSLCPVMGMVAEAHEAVSLPIPDAVRITAGWLVDRARDVYTRLAQHDPAPVAEHPLESSDSWRTTGTCYGLPQVRSRRVYTKLPTDNKPTDVDDAVDGGECNKFYKTYSRNKLAGGILVLWCSHAICLGFHTIPVAEGRNDVFSAIYTRFPQAPEMIVYDFACQLASYSLVREARYFAHTRFLIDEMHAHDHTRCGRACFASNLMRYDERIRAANTSAAECGNQGMGRIRKSVSYMKYDHAVMYTKVFLDVWNRKVIRRILGYT